MLYDCPHCGESLKRKLIRTVAAPGERKFLPSKTIAQCPLCGEKLENNPHPAENKLALLVVPLVGLMLLKDHLESPKTVMLVLGASWALFAMGSLFIERKYLRDWQRYKA